MYGVNMTDPNAEREGRGAAARAGTRSCAAWLRAPHEGGRSAGSRLWSWIAALLLLAAQGAALHAQVTVVLDNPMPPPPWALAQRELIDVASAGVEEFARRFVDERGYLKCVERWGGNDGADDAMENFGGWTLLYLLGGSESVLDLYKQAWEGHILQYTQARAPGIPMAEEGMYWREFVTSFDWEHTGEALAAFHLYGLARPDDSSHRERVVRFADFYTGDDSLADNYDKEVRIIKSLHNGSRGSKLTPATEMDWGGLPVEGAPERLTRYETASNIRGDHPLNLCATALGFNAFALTGSDRYRNWALDYIRAWKARVLENDGNIPTNIGLDGSIGGEWDGKWYGGVFGWNFWPQSDGRNYFIRGPRIGFGIGTLLTGDLSFMDPLRGQITNLYAAKKTVDGKVLLPRKHGDQGFYGYTTNHHMDVQRDVYLATFDRQGLDGIAADPWIRYLDGHNPGYPLEALRADIKSVRSRVTAMREDESIDYERPSDFTQRFNPAVTTALVRLALGGNEPGRAGNVLQSRLFYYDPARSRAGLPEGVAALVDQVGADHVRVHLANTDPAESKQVILQAGAYAEHQFESVRYEDTALPVHGDRFEVRVGPGAAGRLEIRMAVFANRPRIRALP